MRGARGMAAQWLQLQGAGAVADGGQQVDVVVVQQGAGIAAQLRAAGQCIGRQRPALLQRRQNLRAQEIALVLRIGIAGVVDPAHCMRLRIGRQVGACVAEQRAPQRARAERALRTHRRQSVRAGSAQRAQQEGFGLVVTVMRQCQPLTRGQGRCKGRMPRSARSRFQPAAAVACHLYAHDLQGNPQVRALLLAVQRPGVSIRMQAMVDMHGAQAGLAVAVGGGQGVQQHGRIHATAVGDQHRCRWGGGDQPGCLHHVHVRPRPS